MIQSPYDGWSRRPLRVLLALVVAVDVVAMAMGVASNPPRPISHPLAPGALLALGGHPARVVPIAAIGLVALLQFARSAAAIGPGLVALGAAALLCEAHAALIEGPMRVFFAGGATLLGWLAGLGYARALGHSREDADEAERLAELGAVAALCANYLGAATSKLLAGGFDWADANTLRSIIFSQRGVPGSSPFDIYAWAIATHPSFAWGLASATLVIQLGAVIYPFSRITRAVCGTLLFCFHLNVWLLTPIFFPESMILLVAFSYPWPRWISRRRPQAPAPVAGGPTGAEVRQTTLRAAVLVLLIAGVVSILPIRAYTALHHRRPSVAATGSGSPAPAEPPPPPAGPEVRAFLDGLKEGDDLGGFRVEAIWGPRQGAVEVLVSRGAMRFVVWAVRHGSRRERAPLGTPRYDLYYGRMSPRGEQLSTEDWKGVLGALSERLDHAQDRPPPPGW